MKLLFLTIALLLFTRLAAQETAWVFESNMNDSTEHYVFADTAFVRSAASLQASIVDTLFAGHDVMLLQRTPTNSTVRGFTAPWASISYAKNGVNKTAFIWTGLLSFNPMRRGSTKFIFGFDRGSVRKLKDQQLFVGTVLLKVLEKGKIISKTRFEVSDQESLSWIEGAIRTADGLDSVKQIITMTFSGQACGVPAYQHAYAWNGTQLIPMPMLMNVGDADAYWHTEEFVLPNHKNGLASTVIIDVETAELVERPAAKNGFVYEVEGEKKYYSWDGKSFRFVRSIAKKKEIRPYDQ